MDEPRRILIAGGTSGIGPAAALRFAAQPGTRIVLNGRDAGRGAAACAAASAVSAGSDAARLTGQIISVNGGISAG